MGQKKEEGENIHPNRPNITERQVLSKPDPGLFQNPFADDEIFDVINLVELPDTELDPSSTETKFFSTWKPEKSHRIVLLPERVKFDSY